nr:Down syndrome cell adhesion molecule homolog [Parasteatoda tepidariorum]
MQCNYNLTIILLGFQLICLSAIAKSELKIQPFFFPVESVIGKRVSATCTPSTGEKMRFKWLKDGKEITQKKNVNILSYPELSNIVINPLSEDDDGNYTCVVSARGLSGSYTTPLNVLVSPSWKITPQDYDAVSGESIMLHCKGSGKPEPFSFWQRAISQNVAFAPISVSKDVTLFNNGSLLLSDISKATEGIYKCNVSNGIGKDLIKSIIVKVTGMSGLIILACRRYRCVTTNLQTQSHLFFLKLVKMFRCNFFLSFVLHSVFSAIAFDSWKIQPFNFPSSAMVGERVSTVCSTSGGKRLKFEWLKDGKKLTEQRNIKILSVSDVSTLIIDHVSETDSGNYTCQVISETKSEKFVSELVVRVPPEWLIIPTDKDILEGEMVIIPCSANGNPKPSIIWKKRNGNNIFTLYYFSHLTKLYKYFM